MNLLTIFSLLLVIFGGYSAAQNWQRCHGQQWRASCWGPGAAGRGSRGCRPYNAYYYDRSSRQCRPLYYWGCFGNNNRWCSRAACQRACR